jgi:putative ABC transport system substrate-binding protein
MIRRRQFITLLGGAAAWPISAHAQQERIRRVSILVNWTEDDSELSPNIVAFAQALQELGWSEGRNIQLLRRFAGSSNDRYREFAAEIVARAPDVIVTAGGSITAAVQRASSVVPIVFVGAIDPVGAGYVASLAKPGGNATGFAATEFGISAKWLELLKEIAPGVKRVAVIRNTTIAGGGQFGAIQAVASSFGVELRPVEPRDADDIERAMAAFAREPDGGLIVTSSAAAMAHRALIVTLAARYRLPAVYSARLFVTVGGLVSYRFDNIEPYRLAAGYVDRIIRGERPADLPVQAPTKYETAINLKTAKALGLTVPPSLLARADEVIE